MNEDEIKNMDSQRFKEYLAELNKEGKHQEMKIASEIRKHMKYNHLYYIHN
jgi:hypothetical protein